MTDFYITTAIDYTNGSPHIGHAYEKVLADVIARYHRLKGESVFFLTGVDQHGQKVQQTAASLGVEPIEYVERLEEEFLALWERLDVSWDGWAATTESMHKECVKRVLRRLHLVGDIYKAPYRGFFSVRQEQFLTDKERGPDGRFGPEWGEVVEIEEENWYFRLTKYRPWLLEFIDSSAGLITPEFRRSELRNAVERFDDDLSITRPKTRMTWGIDVPFDDSCVTYVWFDALLNYLSFVGYEGYGVPHKWPALHVIGKDILVPAHGIYWLCMLKALGFSDAQMPRFLVHGFVMLNGEKISKSLGNGLDPNAYADEFGEEPLRYGLIRESQVGHDIDFTASRLLNRYNNELANGVGNLLNRTLSMAQKYGQGVLVADENHPLRAKAAKCVSRYQQHMDGFAVGAAIESVLALVTEANQFVDTSTPWKLAKEPGMERHLGQVLYGLAESLRIVAILLTPILPKACSEIFGQLNVQPGPLLADSGWGGLCDGHVTGTPVALFPRKKL